MNICRFSGPLASMTGGCKTKREPQLLPLMALTGVCLLFIAVLFCSASASEGAPEFVRLSDHAFPGRPTKSSVDAYGNVYAIESSRSYISKYSPIGELTDLIQLSSAPLSIKVAGDGRLYAGLKDKIEIYEGRTLIRTVEGISQPTAIEVLSTGTIYAIDLKNYCVKIIPAAGDIVVVGNHDIFGSDLRDLALDEANGEFYILDRRQQVSSLYVWRVQVFDLAGNLLRTFSQYGNGVAGKLISASSLAIDRQRRVYVADNIQNVVGVFDHAGAYLGTIYDLSDPFYNPVDISYRNNRLFIHSFLGQRGTVLGFDGYEGLALLPGRIELKGQGTYISGDRAITLSSTGSGELHWSAASDSAWLGLEKSSGSIGAGLADHTEAVINTSDLVPGLHGGKIRVEFNGGTSYLGVDLNILPPPAFAASPSAISVQTASGNEVEQQAMIDFSNDLSGSLGWTATPDSAWIGIRPSSGVSNALTPVTVTINTAGLTAGLYNGKILLAADGMAGVSSEIQVTLSVSAGNRIQVTTSNDMAHFSITGQQCFTGSGSSWSVGNVPDGTYTITYADVQGYRTPRPETRTISGGSTLMFIGSYEAVRPLSIVASQAGIMDATTVRIFDAGGLRIEFEAFKGRVGGLVTAVGDLNGDGINEIAATIRHGSSRAGIFDRTGRQLAVFSAFAGYGTYDISVADLDNDGAAEMVLAKTSGVPAIRVFRFNNGLVTDTGINFNPLEGSREADLFVGAGDIDDDGKAEIITVHDFGRADVLRVWSPDRSGAAGDWGVSLKNESILNSSRQTSIVSMTVKPEAAFRVMLMLKSGRMMVVGPDGKSIVTGVSIKGVNDMDAGDADGDGNMELVAGLKNGTIKVFTQDGAEIRLIKAFKNWAGATVSTGDLGN